MHVEALAAVILDQERGLAEGRYIKVGEMLVPAHDRMEDYPRLDAAQIGALDTHALQEARIGDHDWWLVHLALLEIRHWRMAGPT